MVDYGGHGADAPLPPLRLSAFELERDLHLGAVGFDLALGVQLQIELCDFGDTKIAQGFSSPVDRRGGGLFPGLLAGTDQLNHLVDALSHVVLPLMSGRTQVLLPRLSLTSGVPA